MIYLSEEQEFTAHEKRQIFLHGRLYNLIIEPIKTGDMYWAPFSGGRIETMLNADYGPFNPNDLGAYKLVAAKVDNSAHSYTEGSDY